MATKGYLMLLGGMREIERILRERMHEDEATIKECGVPMLVESMAEQIEELKAQLAAKPPEAHAEAGDAKALVWIRKKLGLPEDAQMFRGSDTIAGKLHNLCFDAHGYQTYIVAYKCDDKQGEIARLTVRAERAEDRIKELEARVPAAIPEGLLELLKDAMQLLHGVGMWKHQDIEDQWRMSYKEVAERYAALRASPSAPSEGVRE